MLNRRLDFGREFARNYTTTEYFAIVDKVLNLHVSPTIQSFTMYFDPTGYESKVKNWIKIAISKGVEELDLDFFGTWNRHKFRLGTLNLPRVRVLKLSFCEFAFPYPLECLCLLNTLVLKNVNVTTRIIEIVIKNCKHLGTLDIVYCRTIGQIKVLAKDLKCFRTFKVGDCTSVSEIEINSPTLRSFHYVGKIPLLTFVDVFELKDVILNFKSPQSAYVPHYRIRNALWSIAQIHVLTATTVFLEGLTSFYFDTLRGRKGAYILRNLVEFQLFVEGSLICNPYDIGSFIAHCPRLERIKESSLENSVVFKEYQKRELEKFSDVLDNLKFIYIKNFQFQPNELELVKFFLQKAKNLETLVITTPKSPTPKVTAMSIRSYNTLLDWKASPKADISIYHYFNEKCPIDPMHGRIWY
ncbi:hypothetical protein CDL15_Pgr016928 [Punica granatum]|nr:hypothetical protein CDL15_Pgr016928 [Punica granatum]